MSAASSAATVSSHSPNSVRKPSSFTRTVRPAMVVSIVRSLRPGAPSAHAPDRLEEQQDVVADHGDALPIEVLHDAVDDLGAGAEHLAVAASLEAVQLRRRAVHGLS